MGVQTQLEIKVDFYESKFNDLIERKRKVYNSRRYYLHRKLKELGVERINQKIINLPHNSDLFDNKYVIRLRDDFGYSIQTFIC